MKSSVLFAVTLCTALAFLPSAVPSTISMAQGISREPEPNRPTFDEFAQIACHNCYEKSHADTFYKALNGTLTVEIDFYDAQDPPSGGTKPGHWYVRHSENAGKSGNDNNCTGDGKGTNDLAACLGDVARWSQDHPGHDVITVFLDKKQNWGPDRQPADLDRLIEKKIPSEKILTPGDILDAPVEYANLRQAITKGGWPSWSKLKGMFIFVITGGQEDNHNRTQSYYVQKQGRGAICFVAPDTDESSDITGNPNQFDSTTAGYVVFYNLKNGVSKQGDLGRQIHSKRFISRLWGGDDNSCDSYKSQRINLIALFDFKRTCSGYKKWVLPWP
jgi:calcium-dependent phosphoinositide phospholipase C